MAIHTLRLKYHPALLLEECAHTSVSLVGHDGSVLALLDSGSTQHMIVGDFAESKCLRRIPGRTEDVEAAGGLLKGRDVYEAVLILRDAGDLELPVELVSVPSINGAKLILGMPLFAVSKTCWDGPNGTIVMQIDDESDPYSDVQGA